MQPIRVDEVKQIDRLNAKVRLVFNKDVTGDASVSQGVLELQPGMAMVPHVHENSIELFFPLEGEAVLVVAGEEIPVAPGLAAFAPKGVEHFLVNKTDRVFKTVFTHGPHL